MKLRTTLFASFAGLLLVGACGGAFSEGDGSNSGGSGGTAPTGSGGAAVSTATGGAATGSGGGTTTGAGGGGAPGTGGGSTTGGGCPPEEPFGEACTGQLECSYGSETCCGQTYPSIVCDCLGGTFSCYATDACLMPACEECTSDAECPTPGDCELCSDGATYSCAEGKCVSGSCEVVYPPCPGDCPAEEPFGEACSGDLECSYGSETCCGQTYPSIVCDCLGGSFSCYATDACMVPSCDDAGAGCASDEDCPAQGVCEACPDGSTVCATSKCVGGSCQLEEPTCPDPTVCPAQEPFGETCTGQLHCEYGSETCCGQTYPSLVCDCYGGSFSCYATDACMIPSCDDAGVACNSDAECPVPGVCETCWDGSYTCATGKCVSGSCQIEYPACPSPDGGAAVSCGGISGTPCPGSGNCVDDPKDTCDPANGNDCPGICVCLSGALCGPGEMFDDSPSVCACVLLDPLDAGSN